jgi:hypothetical protein
VVDKRLLETFAGAYYTLKSLLLQTPLQQAAASALWQFE